MILRIDKVESPLGTVVGEEIGKSGEEKLKFGKRKAEMKRLKIAEPISAFSFQLIF